MSEITGDSNLGLPFQVSIDPSAQDLPPTMMGAYADVNRSIAYDRTLFGPTLQVGHLSASREDIAETAQEALRRTRQADERTAIVLGAGGCLDIPIEQIITDFDRTIVVDVDTEQTERVLSGLSSSLLGKVSLVRAELSGVAKSINDVFEQASEERDYGRFLNVATAMVRQLDIAGSQVEFGNGYTFVCSQLLMTQLSSIPFTHFIRMMGEKYGRPLTVMPGHEGLLGALDEQNTRLQTGHIDQLNHLVRHDGAIHFADTLGEVRGGQILRMVSPGVIKVIESKFSSLREINTWRYTASPYQTFVVGSFSLISNAAA